MKKQIAVVEDDWGLRDQLVKIIESAPDMECSGAFGSAEEAIPHFGKHSPDVILMDIKLPQMSGIECLIMVKKFTPSVQVIMVTVYKDSERIFQALKAGANGYLIKSAPPEQMIAAIRDVSTGSAPLSGPIALRVVEHFHKMGPAPKEADNLSNRERQVLDLLAMGFTYKEIGAKLNIEAETVRGYVKRICQKLHVRSRLEAVAKHC
ncbi:MAG TPA: response regulator transcription factor [Verrucomicrobiae bacterium]|nr:response regulator transcription factor [Verrucomicrobiae bacterium]